MYSVTPKMLSIAYYVLLALLLVIALAGVASVFGTSIAFTLATLLGIVFASLYITSGIDFDQVSLFMLSFSLSLSSFF